MQFNQAGGVDVNNFLHMVSTAYGEEAGTACLGEEIDDLMPGDDIAELCPSPENFNSDKPIFGVSFCRFSFYDNHVFFPSQKQSGIRGA